MTVAHPTNLISLLQTPASLRSRQRYQLKIIKKLRQFKIF